MYYVELRWEVTTIGQIISLTFNLSSGSLTFFPVTKIIEGEEITTVSKVGDIYIPDSVLYKKLKRKAIDLLVKKPVDTSWLKCPSCGLISPTILEILKTNRIKEIVEKVVFRCSYCKKYFRLPRPPSAFPFYLEI